MSLKHRPAPRVCHSVSVGAPPFFASADQGRSPCKACPAGQCYPVMDDAVSSPYAAFLAELDQIQRHKWLVSESEGRDVGFERALNEWARNNQTEWRREQNRKPVATGRRSR